MRRVSRRAARRDDGFTLVELMVTVSIIGVLAAVAIPRYVSYVRSSQTAEVGQMAGNIIGAVRAYVDQQTLTNADAITAFNGKQLALTPATGTDITALLPQLNRPASANFSYTVSVITATAGPAINELVYCIKAVGEATAGVNGGLVLYSSANATASATGWEGRVNRRPYLAGDATTGLSAGGYCTNAGLAQATHS